MKFLLGLFLALTLSTAIARADNVSEPTPEFKTCIDALGENSNPYESFQYVRLQVAECLLNGKHFQEAYDIIRPIIQKNGEAKNPEVNADGMTTWHLYALVLEGLGRKQEASHAMAVSYNLAEDYLKPTIEKDHQRLNASQIASAAAVQNRQQVAKSRKFWDACSPDERRVLVVKGGKNTNRDHNVGEDWGPDKIAYFDAPNYHQETWWYYGLQGEHSAEAFTFLNGTLHSHYQN